MSGEWANDQEEQRPLQLFDAAKPRGVCVEECGGRRSGSGSEREGGQPEGDAGVPLPARLDSGRTTEMRSPESWELLWGRFLDELCKCSLGLQGERTWSLVPPSGVEISDREAPRGSEGPAVAQNQNTFPTDALIPTDSH